MADRGGWWWVALAVVAGWAAIAGQAAYVSGNLVEPARARTAELSSPRGAPEPGAAPISYYADFDGYYFVSYARQIASGQRLRVRHTRLDNTPKGRPVHWSSLLPWWLAGLGAVHAAVAGLDPDAGVAAAAYYANPLLFACVALLAAVAVFRRAGPVPAVLTVLILTTHPRLLEDFGYAKPDHHGLQLVFAFGTVLCALLGGAGFARDAGEGASCWPAERDARRWMVASGVLGGLGLWAGATQTSVVIASLGGGAAVALWLSPATGAGASFRASLWRAWARAGAATSLVAWGIEYLPDPDWARLEVNHPLFALSWWCGGEVLVGLARWRSGNPSAPRLLAALAGAAVLPLAVAFGPVDWYWPRDAYMLNLHLRIDEFQPLFSIPATAAGRLAALGLPALAVLAATGAVVSGRLAGPARGAVCVALGPCWVLTPWFLFQSRWLGFFAVCGCAVAVALTALAVARRSRASTAWLGAVAIGIAASLLGIAAASSHQPPANGPVALALDVYVRDLALNLCEPDKYRGPVRMIIGPSEAARIHFFGRCRGVGTPYWENYTGLRATADFFTAEDDERARSILAERRIDFVVLANSVPFVEYMQLTATGSIDAAAVERSFGYRLLRGDVPAWLEPIRIRDWPAARNWRIYRFAEGGRPGG